MLGEAEEEDCALAGTIGDQHAVSAGSSLTASRQPLLDDAAAKVGVDQASLRPCDGLKQVVVSIRSRLTKRTSHLVRKIRTSSHDTMNYSTQNQKGKGPQQVLATSSPQRTPAATLPPPPPAHRPQPPADARRKSHRTRGPRAPRRHLLDRTPRTPAAAPGRSSPPARTSGTAPASPRGCNPAAASCPASRPPLAAPASRRAPPDRAAPPLRCRHAPAPRPRHPAPPRPPAPRRVPPPPAPRPVRSPSPSCHTDPRTNGGNPMPRIPLVTAASMTDAQRRVYEAMMNGPRRSPPVGPLAAAMHRPDLAEKWSDLGLVLRFTSSFPPRLREFVILLTGRYWDCQFE